MMMDDAQIKMEILRKLLDAHERSTSYGKPSPWARDVILSIDANTFPEAFSPDGREALSVLRSTIGDLAASGACRVVNERATSDALPRQLRVGPEEISTAYCLAERFGFLPLSRVIAATREAVAGVLSTEMADWARTYLTLVDNALSDANPKPLGMSRERFKRDHRDVIDALRALCAISLGVDVWERMLSEAVFGRTKRLGAIRGLVADLLLRADPAWLGADRDDVPDVLESYGIRRKPGTLRCAGAGAMLVNGREYRLEDFTPTASLPEDWAEAWLRAAVDSAISTITTIENEYSFLSYVAEVGSPAALRERGELVVYVAGFPAPWLTTLLRNTAARTGARLRHWGDADVGGLLIWKLLRTRTGLPVDIFRTTASWVREQARRGGQKLTPRERAALHRLREQFGGELGNDYSDARDIASALLEMNIKLEQERY